MSDKIDDIDNIHINSMPSPNYTYPINSIYNLNLRGRKYSENGDKKRAITDFEAALKIDPKNTEYSDNLKRVRGW